VGEYTAAAIASIAFGQRVAVVDGNVKRLMARVFGIESGGTQLYREAEKRMEELIDVARPGDFNQAVMEFGALRCTPRLPACDDCIFKKRCIALRDNRVDELPLQVRKTKPQKRYFSYLMIRIHGNRDGLFMKKREGNDIWKGLYEFPLIETTNLITEDQLKYQSAWIEWLGNGAEILGQSEEYKHQLTHRTIIARFYTIKFQKHFARIPSNWQLISSEDINALPIPRLIDRYLKSEDPFK
jgi:A/G-specific adenine glycosylase